MDESRQQLADCIVTIGKFYVNDATEEEMAQALHSYVSCPSCSSGFKLVDAVKMEGGKMNIVCPSCGSVEAQFAPQ